MCHCRLHSRAAPIDKTDALLPEQSGPAQASSARAIQRLDLPVRSSRDGYLPSRRPVESPLTRASSLQHKDVGVPANVIDNRGLEESSRESRRTPSRPSDMSQGVSPFTSPTHSPFGFSPTPSQHPTPPVPGGKLGEFESSSKAMKYGAAVVNVAKERVWSIGDGHQRSVRANEGQVEKNVTATLSNSQDLNARSRKASHSLGLFKENAAAQEKRKRQANSVDRLADERRLRRRQASMAGSLPSEAGKNEKVLSRASETDVALHGARHDVADALDIVLSGDSRRQHDAKGHADDLRPRTQSDHQRDTKSASTPGGSSCPSGSERMKLPMQADQITDNDFRAGSMDEMHHHHSLTSGAGQVKGIPIPSSEQFKISPLGTTLSDQILDARASMPSSQSGHDIEPVVMDEEEREGDGSDKDEISSALYFPHRTPPMQVIEEVSPEEKDQFDVVYGGQSILSSNPEQIKEDAVEPIHRMVSAEAKPKIFAEVGPVSSSASEFEFTASESEYESWDEAALSRNTAGLDPTDDVDATPTATPRTCAPVIPPRLAPPQSLVPIGAVELKPYNHQVGGHTTVFRFSRRAVCKSLSNRENEFYETIERILVY